MMDKIPPARGYIYWVDFPKRGPEIQAGKRPAIIVSNNKGNFYGTTVIVAPITSQKKPTLPTHFELPQGTVLCEQLITISQADLKEFVVAIHGEKLLELDAALVSTLDLEGKYSKYIPTKVEAPKYDSKKIDEQIEICKNMRTQLDISIDRLEKLLNIPSPGLKAWEKSQKTPTTGKRIYRKRSLEETRNFIKDWEDSSVKKDVADIYGFSNKYLAEKFYIRWKENLSTKGERI